MAVSYLHRNLIEIKALFSGQPVNASRIYSPSLPTTSAPASPSSRDTSNSGGRVSGSATIVIILIAISVSAVSLALFAICDYTRNRSNSNVLQNSCYCKSSARDGGFEETKI